MPTIVYHGSREKLVRRLHEFVATMAGKRPDDTGVARDILESMALELLGKITTDFVTKSEGGTGEDGVQWKPLSPVTLALRRKGPGKAIKGLIADLPRIPKSRQKLIAIQYKKLLTVYRASAQKSRVGLADRAYARRLLDLMKPYLTPTRYKKTLATLKKDLPVERAKTQALLGAMALILRDTGRFLNSLSPKIVSSDRILRVMPGAVAVGSNVTTRSGLNLLNLHTSDKPRKKKKDGTDKLPRRQILPDAAKPMPVKWQRSIAARGVEAMRSPDVWIRFLGRDASYA